MTQTSREVQRNWWYTVLVMSLKIIFLAVFVLVAAVFTEMLRPKRGQRKYRYKRKAFFMTRAEHECFDSLVAAVGDKYYIFPQVHLPAIIDGKIKGQNWKGAFSHINQKSVDYVLCDKAYLAPKLAIELDDKSHEREDRKVRDAEVERVLAESGVPLLRLENHGQFIPSDLATRIEQALPR